MEEKEPTLMQKILLLGIVPLGFTVILSTLALFVLGFPVVSKAKALLHFNTVHASVSKTSGKTTTNTQIIADLKKQVEQLQTENQNLKNQISTLQSQQSNQVNQVNQSNPNQVQPQSNQVQTQTNQSQSPSSIYGKMPASKAAAIIQQLPDAQAVQVLSDLQKDQATQQQVSDILGAMDPKTAAKYFSMLEQQ